MFTYKHLISLSALVLLAGMAQADSRNCTDGLELQGARGTLELKQGSLDLLNGAFTLNEKFGCGFKFVRGTICQNEAIQGYPQYAGLIGVGPGFTVQEYLFRADIAFCKKFCATPSVTWNLLTRTDVADITNCVGGPTNVLDLSVPPFGLPTGNFATILPGFITLREVTKRGFTISFLITIAAPILPGGAPANIIPDGLITGALSAIPAQVQFHAFIEDDSCEKGCKNSR